MKNTRQKDGFVINLEENTDLKTKHEILTALAHSGEEKILLASLLDKEHTCETRGYATSTRFLSMSERALCTEAVHQAGATGHALFWGGYEDAERGIYLFYPDYMDEESARLSAPLALLRAHKSRSDTLTHRDYLGAILGLGIRREWVGDILVQEHGAYVFCLPSVAPALLELEQVGRTGVKAAAVELAAVPVPERKVRPVTFTVQSARLDAVVSGMFRLSRTSAAAQIRAGAVHLNYTECLRPDAPVAPGDVLSLRGAGKGSVTEVGGMSRKGRQFVTAELWQ